MYKFSEYKTPGYGCVEQTDPLLAFILGQKRTFKKTSVEAMVQKTVAAINSAWNIGQ